MSKNANAQIAFFFFLKKFVSSESHENELPWSFQESSPRKYLKYGQHFLYRGVCGSVPDDSEKLERASPTTGVLLVVSS